MGERRLRWRLIVQAIVFTRYGSPDVLELREVARPVPKDDEVLIRVHAASINDWDWGALHGTDLVNRLIFGLVEPKKQILGSDIAGRVEAVGKNVRRFRVGDEVFGDLSGVWGGFAEYVCARETAVVRKPASMTFEQAAAIPQAALLALQSFRLFGPMQPGQTILINGAGGGVGTFAVQIARRYGAVVTVVDSAAKLDMLRALGAAHAIDYTKEDFTRRGQRYDFILDVKTARSAFDYARALNRGGTYVTVGGSMTRLLRALLWAPWFRRTAGKRIRVLMLKPNEGLDEMIELFDAGVLPVIDGPYPFRDLPRAFRYFGEARHQGKVVLTLDPRAPRNPSASSPVESRA
jgi:NADPH:quinone reductase-like Zn-dependent oxidoreductase